MLSVTGRISGPLARWLQELNSAVRQGGSGVLSGMQPVSFHVLELLLLDSFSSFLRILHFIFPVAQPGPAFLVNISTVNVVHMVQDIIAQPPTKPRVSRQAPPKSGHAIALAQQYSGQLQVAVHEQQ